MIETVQRCKSAVGLCKRANNNKGTGGLEYGWLGVVTPHGGVLFEVGLALRANLAVSGRGKTTRSARSADPTQITIEPKGDRGPGS